MPLAGLRHQGNSGQSFRVARSTSSPCAAREPAGYSATHAADSRSLGPGPVRPRLWWALGTRCQYVQQLWCR